MSWITEVVVFVPLDFRGKMQEHLASFEWDGRQAIVRPVDVGGAGGTKAFGSGSLFAGAFNFLPTQEFIAHLAAFDWPYPESTAVLLQPESGSTVIWTPKLDVAALRRDGLFLPRFIVGQAELGAERGEGT